MRVDLPDGAWAEYCPPRKVSDRKRRAYMRAMSDVSAATADIPQVPGPPDPKTGLPGPPQPDGRYMSGEQTELQFHALDLLIMCFLKAWSYPTEPSLEAVEDLDADSKDTLLAHALPLMGDMMPNFEPDPDPKARTNGSSTPPTTSPKALSTSATPSSDSTY